MKNYSIKNILKSKKMSTKSSTAEIVKSQQEQHSEESTNKVKFGNVESDKRSEITQQRWPIAGTIFSIGWMKDKGYAIGLDGKRLTEWVETESEIYEKIEKGGLTLAEVSRMIYVIVEDIKQQQELLNKKL